MYQYSYSIIYLKKKNNTKELREYSYSPNPYSIDPKKRIKYNLKDDKDLSLLSNQNRKELNFIEKKVLMQKKGFKYNCDKRLLDLFNSSAEKYK